MSATKTYSFFQVLVNSVHWRRQQSRITILMHNINIFSETALITVSERAIITSMIECISRYISATLAWVVQYQEVHNVTLGVPPGYAVIIWNEYFNYVAASDKCVFALGGACIPGSPALSPQIMKPWSALAALFLFQAWASHRGVDYIDNGVHTAGIASCGVCPYLNGPGSYYQ